MKKSFYVCSEMNKLREALTLRGIHWTDMSDIEDFFWICRTWFWHRDNKVSVIHGYGTYGGIQFGRDGELLEVYSTLTGNEPIGHLTAADIIRMIFKGQKDENGTEIAGA